MRIFLGLSEISGYMGKLDKGLQENGVRSIFLNLGENYYQYSGSSSSLPSKIARHLAKTKRILSFLPVKALCWLALFMLKMILFIRYFLACDIFVFGYGESFFWLMELFAYRLARKRLIFIFFGSDSRPFFLNGLAASRSRGVSPETCIAISKKQKKRIRRIERFADVIIAHPPSSQFHEVPFIPFLKIGFPGLSNPVMPIPHPRQLSEVRILHAPSSPECKGTDRIRGIIKMLQEGGERIAYIELIGMSNAKVLEELAACDFVIDELYSDTCLAGLSTEAAFYGKPAVIGSYADYQSMGLSDSDQKPPSCLVLPEEAQDAISTLIRDRMLREQLGKKAQAFVQTEWSSRKVAERFLRVARGDFPKEWLFAPQSITYLHGWGIEENSHRQYLRAILRKYPISSLGISDKPALIAKLRSFLEDQ